MRATRSGRLGLATIAVALLPPAVAAAAGAGQAEFGSGAPLAIAAGKSAVAKICGIGSARISYTLALEGIPHSAISFAGVTGGRAPSTVAPGTCTSLKLTVRPGAATASGTLILVSSGRVARRPLAVTGAQAAEVAPAAPLDGVSLRARHGAFGHGKTRLLESNLPFGPYKPGTTMDVAAVDAPAGTLAVLQSGSDRAYLVRDGAVRKADARGVVELPVRLDGADRTGTYSGSASFTDAQGTKTQLKVSVAVGDSVWWCIAAIVAGIALTALATFVSQRLWPAASLASFRRNLDKHYTEAAGAFNAAAAAANEGSEGGAASPPAVPTRTLLPTFAIDADAVDDYARQLRQAYKRYVRRHPLVDPDSSDYTSLQDLIDKADDDRAYLGDPHGLLEALNGLRAALDSFDAQPQGDEQEPQLLAGARSLLTDGPIGVGDATARGADAAAYTTVLQQWPTLLTRLRTLEAWARDLAGDRPADEPRRYVQRAQVVLAVARGALFDAETAAALTQRHVASRLDEAEARLHEAEAFLQPRPDTVVRMRESAVAAVQTQSFIVDSERMARLSLSFHAATLALPGRRVVEQARQLLRSPAAERTATALAYGTVGAAGYTLVTLLAIGGAVATGLSTVYSPTFGSLTDYLTVLGIGGAAAVASKALIDAIANMRRAPR